MAISRIRSVRVTLSEEEDAKLTTEADRQGLNKSDLIRQMIRAFESPIDKNKEEA